MKKYFTTLTILSFLFSSCNQQSIKVIREFNSEKSASIDGYNFKVKNCSKDLHFDKNGNRIIELRYLPPCDSFTKLTYYYDKNLLVREEEHSTSRGLIQRKTYQNDSLGRVIEQLDYDGNEDLKGKVTYEYNKDGQLQSEKSYLEPENSLWTTTTYTYDSTGNMIEWLTLRFDGLFYAKVSYKYDGKGNKIEEVFYQEKTVVRHKMTFKYNDEGIVIEETLGGLGSHFDFEMKVVEITYDKMGNWIKKVCQNKDSTYSLITREIEYHK